MRRAFGIALCLMSCAAAAAAQPADEGLDLVMLVDRSTSMALEQSRFRLLLRATVDVLARNAKSTRAAHRLAVVSFGESATTDIPLRPVDRERLHQNIDRLPPRDMGETNVLVGLSSAHDLLRAEPVSAARRRAIVLVTDGIPYVRGADMDAYRRELRRLAAMDLKPVSSFDVLLLAPSRHRNCDAWWRQLAPGHVHAASSAGELLAATLRVVAGLAGTRTVESRPVKRDETIETIVIPPYLDVVVFDVVRESSEAVVSIFRPGARKPLRTGDPSVEVMGLGDVLSSVVVHRPPPGEWIVRRSKSDARIRVVSEQFFPRGVLMEPGASETLRQYDRARITYRVVNPDGEPFVELPRYELALDVTLTKPDGGTERLAMKARSAAVFASARRAECDLAGRYWTDVRITTTDLRGRPVEIFRDRWSGFSVAAAERVDCRVTAPAVAGWTRSIPTNIDCVDAHQRPVDMAAIITDPARPLFQLLLLCDGEAARASLDLRYIGRGAFRGWLYAPRSAGAYELELSADRSRIRDPYNIRFRPASVAFVRQRVAVWSLPLALVVACACAAVVLIRRDPRRRPRI